MLPPPPGTQAGGQAVGQAGFPEYVRRTID
jgi:hypothetical protein